MLHTKVQGNRSTGSKEEVSLRIFLPYMDKEAIWSCDQHYINIFSFSCTEKASIHNLVKKGQAVYEKNK